MQINKLRLLLTQEMGDKRCILFYILHIIYSNWENITDAFDFDTFLYIPKS